MFVDADISTRKRRFGRGLFVDRKAILPVTVDTGAATDGYARRRDDIDLLLRPVNFLLANE